MRKYRNGLAVLAVVVLSVVGTIGYLSSPSVYADPNDDNYTSEGSSTTEGGGGKKGCATSQKPIPSIYDDTCHGGLWWKYPVPAQGGNEIKIPDYGAVKGGTLRGCVDDGATEYYRLALVKYRVKTDTTIWENGAPAQVGLWQVRKFGVYKLGGSTTYAYADGGEDPINEVQKKFETAVKHGASMDGNEWKDVSMFCYNEKWEENTSDSSFSAWSFVGTSTTTGDFVSSSSGGPDYETLTKNYQTQEETFKISLWHQMSYERPTTTGTYAPAQTHWRTEVTIDGQIQNDKSVTSPQTLTNTDSGPANDRTWWGPYIGRSDITVTIPENGSVEVCSRIIYEPKNIKWKEENGKYVIDSTNGNEDSKACAIISRDPVEPEQPVEDVGQIRFISQSGVEGTSAANRTHSELSNPDGADTVTVYISTDKESTQVGFWHNMKYVYESASGGTVEAIESKDKFENPETRKIDPQFVNDYIATNWIVKRQSAEKPKLNTEDADPRISDKKFHFSTSNPNGINFRQVSPPSGRHQVTIDGIEYGDSIKVCEKITFKPATFRLQRREVKKHLPNYVATGTYEGYTLYLYNSETDSYTAAGNAVYHWGPTGKNDMWGNPEYGDVQGLPAKGEPVYTLTGDTLYQQSQAYVSAELDVEVSNQTVYIEKVSEEYPYEVSYVQSSIYHYEDGRWVPGYKYGSWNAGPNGESLWTRDYVSVHDYWIYSPIMDGGQGYDESLNFSEACISVTRPEEVYKPGEEPDVVVKGPISGSADSSFMYAEEQNDGVKWNTAATSYAVRRVMEAKAIVYEPSVTVSPNLTEISKGNLCDEGDARCRTTLHSNSKDPCAWYTSKVGMEFRVNPSCSTIVDKGISGVWPDGYNGGTPFSADHVSALHRVVDANSSVGIIVPSYVGDKYCNSYGYKLAYWWGVTHSNPESSHWERDGDEYWSIYDAACRTIVKKPTLNVWNSGVFTGGGINTTISNRFYQPFLGATIEYLGTKSNRNAFGSWAEYLAVPSGEIKGGSAGGFSSGAMLGYSGYLNYGSSDLLGYISPLTISNAGSPYGLSGITPRSTYRTRLSAYLKNNSSAIESSLSDIYGEHSFEDDPRVRVVNIGGATTIDEDIIINNNSESIYRIPQIIIFADGDIDIKSNVSRIDAWLISTGEINTCSDFEESKESAGLRGTEALVRGYNDSPVCSKQLSINGPVLAQSMKFNRSAGTDQINYNQSSNPEDMERVGMDADARVLSGEVLNLGADAYLWAYAQAGRYDSSYTESYARELPPRY